jgi:ribonuclease BN (tRNA processing enzyme)
MSSPLHIVALGTGDAFSAARYSASLLVGYEGRWLLIDCPHPIRKMLREATGRGGVSPVDIGDLEGCVLTHLHADHASGVEGLGFFGRFALGRRIDLYAHQEVVRDLWLGHLAAGMGTLLSDDGPKDTHLDDFFAIGLLDEDAPITIGPFTVRCRRTFHHVPTFALRVEAGGRSLGYSADAAFDPALIDWLCEADLVVHETNHGVHTPFAALDMLDDDRKAKMRLIAFPDGFDAEPRSIRCLTDGQHLTIAA